MKIAVVGSGVAGLVAARELVREHEVDVYEAGDHVGGHTHTHAVEIDGKRLSVDTGFIVFNAKTYPNFCRLLDELGVAWQPSDMSLSVRCELTGLEYNGRDLDTVFAQRTNLLRPSFLRMLRDVLRFHREAPSLLEPAAIADEAGDIPLREWLDARRYSRPFRELYLAPMAAAIWSAPPEEVDRYPARFLVRFMHNHGMLQVDDRPQWRVVRGGSARYVEALIRAFGSRIHLDTPVRSVRRFEDHVELELGDGRVLVYDHVVVAAHSDQALAMLTDADANEREVLGAIRYQENEAVLHTDARFLPKLEKCWASWNCHLLAPESKGGPSRVAVTYWMNRLQSLPIEKPVLVTLNRGDEIDPSCVLKRLTYHHPQFTRETVAAQSRWHEINGARRTWFCGAYWGFGFHEDGVKSGLAVARGFEQRRNGGRVLPRRDEALADARAPSTSAPTPGLDRAARVASTATEVRA